MITKNRRTTFLALSFIAELIFLTAMPSLPGLGVPPPPPPCGGAGQPACPPDVSLDPWRFPGPGQFTLSITLSNATLTGSLTCDHNVAISVSGSLVTQGGQQIMPALIEIPPNVPQGEWAVDCSISTDAGILSFGISIGPEPPSPPPPPPPPCGGLGQPLCVGVSISANTMGPGPFPLFIIVINAMLSSSVICDNSVTISPSGPPVLFQDEQITPMLIEIPPGFPQGTTSVFCRIPISTGISIPWDFTINVCDGAGQKPCPYILTLDKTSVTCEAAGQTLTLQAVVTNGPAATPVYSITGDNPWLILDEVSPRPPFVLASGEERQLSLLFRCYGAGTFPAPFVRISSEVPPVPPTPPPATKTIEQTLDTNGNGIIDDDEIIAAIGYWVSGAAVPGTDGQTINDQEMLKLAALWTTGNPISSAGTSAARATSVPMAGAVKGKAPTLNVKSIKAQMLDHRVIFTVSGDGVAEMEVHVYDLSGRIVFDQATTGTTLIFRGLSSDGRPLANGVYLYTVAIKGVDGRIMMSEIKKLVILR